MTTSFPLAELTATMMREVFQAISDSAMDQTDAYVDIAAEVGVPLDAYQSKIVGATTAERQAKADAFILEIIAPALAVPKGPLPDPLVFDDAGKGVLLDLFAAVYAALPGANTEVVLADAIGSQGSAWVISLDDLRVFVIAKLLRDGKRSYDKLRALLANGVPNVVATGGEIETKVTMSTRDVVGASGKPQLGLSVRLADERSLVLTRSTELVGRVKLDFAVRAFPPLTLPVTSATPQTPLLAAGTNLGKPLFAVWGSGPDDVYVAGASGSVFHHQKSSIGFDPESAGVPWSIHGVWGSTPSDVYLVGDLGILYGKTSSWSLVAKGSDLRAVWGTTTGEVYAVGGQGAILYTKGGGGWVQLGSGTSATLEGVWGSGPDDVYAVGQFGTILRASGAIGAFVAIASGVKDDLHAVWGSSKGDVYAVGDHGTILRSSDGGVTWQQLASGTTEHLHAIWGSGPDDVFAAGGRGRIHHTSDGKTWKVSRIGAASESIRGVWGSGPDDVYAVCEDGRLLHTTDGGITWA